MARARKPATTAGPVLTGCAVLGLLAGCAQGSADTGSHAAGTPEAVPAGVAAQYATVNREIKAEGGETTSGEWRIGYIVEPAEPWFENSGGTLGFREPAAGETHHIEIVPFEAAGGRIVPDVPIFLEVLDGAGAVVDAKKLNFYHAEFFHYANNFSVPTAGTYTLRATLEAPAFSRHGESTERPALSDGATVEFTGVELAT